MKGCEHNWVYEAEDLAKLGEVLNIDNDVIRIPIICTECGLRADETWYESMITDKVTGEPI